MPYFVPSTLGTLQSADGPRVFDLLRRPGSEEIHSDRLLWRPSFVRLIKIISLTALLGGFKPSHAG
jgi:hypothetical protein